MKKKIRRVMAFVLTLGCTVSFTACNGGISNLPLEGQIDSKTKELERNDEVIFCFDDSVVAYDGYDESVVNTALTEFALRMLEKDMQMELADGNTQKNILISPASMITALGMTSFGARGETLLQMEEVFGVKRGYLNLNNSQFLDKKPEEVKIANSIWFTNDERVTVKDEFLQFQDETYDAEIYETAFNEATKFAINDWVEKNTDGMIKDIIDEVPQDAVMYLINALAFEAEWEEKYETIDIREDAKFTTSTGEEQTADLMHSEEFLYLEDDNAKGFIKYYKDKNYAFVALLPDEGMSVEEYVKTLSGESLQQMLSNPREIVVNAHIPQFSYEYDTDMKEVLKEMGMTDAFDGGRADFSAMVTSTRGNVFLNRVLHKAFIEVTPVGTKAGAATVVEAMDESAPFYEEIMDVRLDRPFLYMIMDCDSNHLVFIGAVNSIY